MEKMKFHSKEVLISLKRYLFARPLTEVDDTVRLYGGGTGKGATTELLYRVTLPFPLSNVLWLARVVQIA